MSEFLRVTIIHSISILTTVLLFVPKLAAGYLDLYTPDECCNDNNKDEVNSPYLNSVNKNVLVNEENIKQRKRIKEE